MSRCSFIHQVMRRGMIPFLFASAWMQVVQAHAEPESQCDSDECRKHHLTVECDIFTEALEGGPYDLIVTPLLIHPCGKIEEFCPQKIEVLAEEWEDADWDEIKRQEVKQPVVKTLHLGSDCHVSAQRGKYTLGLTFASESKHVLSKIISSVTGRFIDCHTKTETAIGGTLTWMVSSPASKFQWTSTFVYNPPHQEEGT